MKGLRTLLPLQKPSPKMTNLKLTWAGNLKVPKNENKGNANPKHTTIKIHNSRRKNSRFGVSSSFSMSLLIQNYIVQKHRQRLVRELSARMERDKQLRYAERELEM